MRVLFFGDSIVYGSWDSEGGWVDRLKREAHEITLKSSGSRKLQFVNLGIGGDCSTKVLARLKNEINARASASWPFAFVLALGANDERTVDGVPETSLELFEDNLRRIIEILKSSSDKILFLGIPPVGDDVVELKGRQYSNEGLARYDAVVERVTNELGVKYVSLRQAFEASGMEALYSYDNIHPNDSGHELIAATIRPHLIKILEER
jgi:lysophospholipase L1-like esterase